MKINKDIGTRMKQYEAVTRDLLIPHLPTIIRLDGKTFHTFTKGMNRPFDSNLHDTMCFAMEQSIEKVIQNCVLSYTQSDEISLLLVDFPNFNTEQWFNGNIQKIVSVSASAVTAYFNSYFQEYHAKEYGKEGDLAFFDSRVYQMPKEEIANYFIWRQQDATRNSVQMLGQSKFSHKELHGVSCNQIQDKLMLEHKINWNDLDVWKKRGTCCYKIDSGKFALDYTPPIFTKDRQFIDKLLDVEL